MFIYRCHFALVLKSPDGEWPIKYMCFFFIIDQGAYSNTGTQRGGDGGLLERRCFLELEREIE